MADLEGKREETGTSNPLYNLVSVLYHALQGVETCGQYLADAERADDDALVDFFQAAQASQRELSERAKALLREHLASVGDDSEAPGGRGSRRAGPMKRGGSLRVKAQAADTVQEASEESFPASDPPAY